MRGIGAHVPPARMQPEPPDNTSRYVNEQVKAFYWRRAEAPENWDLSPHVKCGELIHTESAREIASWFASAGKVDMPFTTFASTGAIGPDLLAAIAREISGPYTDVTSALIALRAYVNTVTVPHLI